MRVLLSLLILGLLGIASALSTSGNRLLVVLEELVEKDKYSKFFGDLEGKTHGLTKELAETTEL
jgi:oligosaccharyltransferase complex subunit beta